MDHVSIRSEPGPADEVNYVFSISPSPPSVKRLLNLNLANSGNNTCVCLYKVLIEQ